ncbi:Crp/Fnr family transcriptional regulator [Methylocapsa sp. S129]|uniref:Crp/Fnr family transcriptional regulator n=1 Tax=Methylocapsa sp. S129 TaxID=1641869 RepID=UPI00131CB025|nr:Crp/Fnr family transcriptional regulator [Methylocapsa sp. S129]
MALADDIERLSRTRPFNLLPREAIQLVAFSAEKRMLSANESLFEEGDLGDCGYFVLSGAIILTARGHAGERAHIAHAGTLIGENAMVAEVHRPSSARARENSIVLRIPRQVFHRVLGEFPKEAARIRANLATRMRKISGELEELRRRAIDPVR